MVNKDEMEEIAKLVSQNIGDRVFKEIAANVGNNIARGVQTAFLNTITAYDPQHGSVISRMIADGVFKEAIAEGVERYLTSIHFQPKEVSVSQA